jgi:uncharacterized protein (UPF0261 family)
MTPPTSGPDPYLTAISLARLETKVDIMLTVQGAHGTDLEELKRRRWPLSVVTVLLSAVGCGGGLVALLHK